jgi:hypothetical protein
MSAADTLAFLNELVPTLDAYGFQVAPLGDLAA